MQHHEEQDEVADFGLLDEKNPRSLIRIVPDEVARAIKAVPRELLLMDERELRRKAKPTDTVNYLRLNFWIEYNRAQAKRVKMVAANILRGACSKEYFYEVVKNDLKLAWILLPPADYTVVQYDIFQTSLEKLRQCLRVKPYTITVTEETDKEGRKTVTRKQVPNVAAMREIREITAMLSDRIQGAVVKKLAIKAHSTADVNVSGGQAITAGPRTYEPDALDELNRTLQQVNASLQLPAAEACEGEVIDIDEEDADAEGA